MTPDELISKFATSEISAKLRQLANALDQDIAAAIDQKKAPPQQIGDGNYPTAAKPSKPTSSALAGLQKQDLGSFANDLSTLSTFLAPNTKGGDVAQEKSDVPRDVSSSPTPFSDFLVQVGSALKDAQHALDTDLARQVVNDPRAVAYRIPKLSAEISFGVEIKDSKGFNILIASKEEEQRKSLQQKVSFDVVAAPLPPELAERAALAQFIAARLPQLPGGAIKTWTPILPSALFYPLKSGVLAIALDGTPQTSPTLRWLIAPLDTSFTPATDSKALDSEPIKSAYAAATKNT